MRHVSLSPRPRTGTHAPPRPSPANDAPPPDVTRRCSLAALLGLWAFAVTQPILAALGEEPGFFIVRQTGRATIVAFSIALATVPPLLVWAVGGAVRRVDLRAGQWFDRIALASIVALAVGPLLRGTGTGTATTAAILVGLVAVAAGALFAWAYERFDGLAAWARFTAVLPVLSVAMFLLASPTGLLLKTTDAPIASARSDAPVDGTSVVFLMLDELPTASILDADGSIDADRFPNLATLAQGSTWYRNHTAAATSTAQAVPAVLTGEEPTGGPPSVAVYPHNLFTLLAPTHDLHVSEHYSSLCPRQLCDTEASAPPFTNQISGLTADTTAFWLDRINFATEPTLRMGDFAEAIEDIEVNGEIVGAPARFSEFLDGLAATADRPSLSYLHLLLPHAPWNLYPDGRSYDITAFPHGDYEDDDEAWMKAVLQQRHLFQAQYADRLVGSLLDRLHEIGTYDDTLIVAMADHGISFRQGSHSRLWGDTNAADIAYSPLIIKAPRQAEGAISDANVSGIDVLPTVAELLEVPVGWATDGAPADSDEVRERDDHKVIFDIGSWETRSVRNRHEFTIADTTPSAASRFVGSAPAGGAPLAGLLGPLGVDPWLGRPLAEIIDAPTGADGSDPATPGTATLAVTDGSGAPSGIVRGTVADAPAGAMVLVAVDGVVVTASPIITVGGTANSFLTLLPPDAPRNQDRVIEVGLVVGLDGPTPTVVGLGSTS